MGQKLKISKNEVLFLIFIFLLGFALRVWSVWPHNTIIGFDQVRDLWDATKIFRDHDLRVIGPTAGNNPNLHHGVLFLYYLIPPLILFKGNPMGVVFWNSIFNAAAGIVLYFLAKDIFKSRKARVIAAILCTVSYQVVQYSGWISNPTVTVFTAPLFFYFLWKYYQKKEWAFPLATFFMGLTIEFELFFIYLIPIGILMFLLLKIKFPRLKILTLSILAFCIATSSMIATEIKFGFSGIKSIFQAGQYVGGGRASFTDLVSSFLQRWDAFSLNFSPQFLTLGAFIGIIIMSFLVFELVKNKRNKEDRDKIVFVLIYFLSPVVMFLLGSHNAPWFLIGRPRAIILAFSFVLLKINSRILLALILVFVIISNLFAIRDSKNMGQILLEPDASAILDEQIKAMDYTYQSSNGARFAINSVTNPLYINALWSYDYYWYGGPKYGLLPTWIGGDQIYPYDSLKPFAHDEKYLYILIDDTSRIPDSYRLEAENSADKISKLIETKDFGGISVQKRELW